MTENKFAHLTEIILNDVATAFGLPTAALALPFHAYMKRKCQEAQERLLDEMRKGGISDFEAAERDEAVATIYRVGIAARDGAARRNLRLLAQAVVGLVRTSRLFSDEFNKYSEILARLSRDQMVVLGRLRVHHLEVERRADGPDQDKLRQAVFQSLEAELVPSQFATREHITTIYSQLTGLGLMNAASAFGGLAYTTSPLFHDITKLVDFEECLRQEG